MDIHVNVLLDGNHIANFGKVETEWLSSGLLRVRCEDADGGSLAYVEFLAVAESGWVMRPGRHFTSRARFAESQSLP